MKIAYEHLLNFIEDKPSIEDISEKLFQLGHEHEIDKNILNFEFTPNRGDCFSHLGVAREIAILENKKISVPEKKIIESSVCTDKEISVDILDKDACPR